MLTVFLVLTLVLGVVVGLRVVGHSKALSILQADLAAARMDLDRLGHNVSISGLVPPYPRPGASNAQSVSVSAPPVAKQ